MSSFDGNWEDPNDNAANIAWVRQAFNEVAEYRKGSTYTNFTGQADETNEALARNAYGANTARLRTIKKRYDPDNFFRINPNIVPEQHRGAGRMNDTVLVNTRRSLHAIAELLIAGPQYRALGTIRLRVTSRGFAGVAMAVGVEGTELVWSAGRARLQGTIRQLADLSGLDAGPPAGLYADSASVGLDDPLDVDPSAAEVLVGWLQRGDAALRSFAPTVQPVLWPEHFDLAVTVDEVNYGVSPGDSAHPRPYAYVAPWSPRVGEFWNTAFGAARPIDQLADVAAVVAFFGEGRDAL